MSLLILILFMYCSTPYLLCFWEGIQSCMVVSGKLQVFNVRDHLMLSRIVNIGSVDS